MRVINALNLKQIMSTYISRHVIFDEHEFPFAIQATRIVFFVQEPSYITSSPDANEWLHASHIPFNQATTSTSTLVPPAIILIKIAYNYYHCTSHHRGIFFFPNEIHSSHPYTWSFLSTISALHIGFNKPTICWYPNSSSFPTNKTYAYWSYTSSWSYWSTPP